MQSNGGKSLPHERRFPLDVCWAVEGEPLGQIQLQASVRSRELRITAKGVTESERNAVVPRSWLRQGKVMRPQFAARGPTEVMAVRDLFLGPEFVAQHGELRDKLSRIVKGGNGDEDVENGFGTQADDGGASDVVHGQDRWRKRCSELRRRFLKEGGPARVVGNNNNRSTPQPEWLRNEHWSDSGGRLTGRAKLWLARQISDAAAPEGIKLTLRNLEKAGGGAEYTPWFTASTRQFPDGRKPASVVHHPAENRDAIISDVERAGSRWWVCEDVLERQISVGIEVSFEPGHQLVEGQPR